MAAKKSKQREPEKFRLRSPNYPAVGLREAVERVRALVEKDGKAGAKLDVAARHIGFSGPHGTARTVLSALRKFGLTSDQNGRIVPTQVALDIIHFPLNHERSIAARRTAATSPAIYRQLIEQFSESGNLPSPESLQAELVADMGFNPKAVSAFLHDFYDTLNYAVMLSGNDLLLSGIGLEEEDETSESSFSSDSSPSSLSSRSSSLSTSASSSVSSSSSMQSSVGHRQMRELTLPLMGNEIALLRVPAQLSEENYDYLLQQLGMLKRGLVAKLSHAAASAVVDNSEITLEMRHKLLSFGYKPASIAALSLSEAQTIIAENTANPE